MQCSGTFLKYSEIPEQGPHALNAIIEKPAVYRLDQFDNFQTYTFFARPKASSQLLIAVQAIWIRRRSNSGWFLSRLLEDRASDVLHSEQSFISMPTMMCAWGAVCPVSEPPGEDA